MSELPNKEALMALVQLTKEVTDSLKRSNIRGGVVQPYYTPKWAQGAKEILELVTSTGEPRLVREGDYTAVTLKNQWYQGKKYLLDHLDPDGKYKDLDSRVEVNYLRKRGLSFSPRRQKGLLASIVCQPWRTKLEEFMETAEHMDKFERMSVGLNDDDFIYVQDLLGPVADMFEWKCDLRGDHLLVIRVDKNQLESVK